MMASSVVPSALTRSWYETCFLTLDASFAEEILVCPVADKIVS
jgi:hypothetical protein